MTYIPGNHEPRTEPLGPAAAPAQPPLERDNLAPTQPPTPLVPPKRKSGVWVVVAFAAALILLAGGAATAYGLTSRHAAPSAQASPTPAAVVVPAAPATTVAAPPKAAPVAHKLGETVASGTLVSSTVYAYKQPVAPGATRPSEPGFTWGAADIKVCAGSGAGLTGDGITITNQPWALTYADSTVIGPSSIGYQQFPQPEYPWGDRSVSWNRCVRGWVTFAVPAGQRPVMVEYQPRNSDVAEPITDWTI